MGRPLRRRRARPGRKNTVSGFQPSQCLAQVILATTLALLGAGGAGAQPATQPPQQATPVYPASCGELKFYSPSLVADDEYWLYLQGNPNNVG